MSKREKAKPKSRAVKERKSIRMAAVRYAKMGWAVIPLYGLKGGHCACPDGKKCTRAGKHPRVTGGVNAATTDVKKVLGWFKKWPNANIGIATGRISEILILDVDRRHDGEKSLRKLEKSLGKLPETFASKTGDGFHLVFQLPPEAMKTDLHGRLVGHGVDVLSNRSYFVAPPSRHVKGVRYGWLEAKYPKSSAVAKLPLLWRRHLNAKLAAQPAEAGKKVLEGGRNDHLARVAGKLRGRGKSTDEITEALLLENKKQCVPPLDDQEVWRIATSISKYPPNDVSDTAELLMREVLAQHFAEGRHLIVQSARFWVYTGRFWKAADDRWIRGRILETIETSGTASRAKAGTANLMKQTFVLLEAKLATNDDRLNFVHSPPPVINCLNGEVWLDDEGAPSLRSHRPESYLRHCLNVEFDSGAECPMYDRALRGIFSNASDPKSMSRTWNEFLGYLIQPRRNIPLITLLRGGGDNGKTKLISTGVKLIGQDNVSALSIKDIEKNRFAVGSLFGKSLLVDDDVSAGTKLPDGLLKTISEEKVVTGEDKFKPQFNFMVRVAPVLLCNNVPSIADVSYGMVKRLRVIPFDKKFSKEERDPSLFDRIWSSELPGVLNRAISGYMRVVKRGNNFDWPADVEDATKALYSEANPLDAFVTSVCSRGVGNRIILNTFYEAYRKWCDASGVTMAQQHVTVRRNLQHMGFCIKHTNKGDAVFGLEILKLA